MTLARSASLRELEALAKRVRRHVIAMTAAAGSGHPGGSLSCADILAALYGCVLRRDPANPAWPMAFVGMQDQYATSGRWDLLKHYGLTPEKIAEAARGVLARKGH